MQQAMIYDPFEFAQQLARLGQDGDVTDVLQQPTPEGERARYLKRILFDQRGAERQLVTADDGMIAPGFSSSPPSRPTSRQRSALSLGAARLSQLSGKPIAVPPILLLGSPGVGKTFWARACAKAIGVAHAEYSMNVQDDPGGLVGHSLSWRAARPGLVARTLLEGPSAFARAAGRRNRQSALERSWRPPRRCSTLYLSPRMLAASSTCISKHRYVPTTNGSRPQTMSARCALRWSTGCWCSPSTPRLRSSGRPSHGRSLPI